MVCAPGNAPAQRLRLLDGEQGWVRHRRVPMPSRSRKAKRSSGVAAIRCILDGWHAIEVCHSARRSVGLLREHGRCKAAAFGIALRGGKAAGTLLGCGCSSGVEHNLAKVGVEGSNPFARSKFHKSNRKSVRSVSERHSGAIGTRMLGAPTRPDRANKSLCGADGVT